MIRNSLFIFSFKKNKRKYVQRIVSVLGMFLVFYGVCQALDFMFVWKDEWVRKVWHDYYAFDENIDTLFIGSSHVYRDINPVQLDQINGMNHFDLSVHYLPLNGAYYMIREVNEQHNLSHVYVELYYDVVNVPLNSQAAVERNWYSLDNMNMSINKIEYMYAAISKDKFWDTLFPFVRYREYLFDGQHISANIRQKQTVYYKNHFVNGSGLKGYQYYMNGLVSTQMLKEQTKVFDETYEFPKDAEDYLKKIIEYCRKEDIELTFIISPEYDLLLISVENYDFYVDCVRQLAQGYNVPFYDFNLCKPEYLMIGPEEAMDSNHLNAKGSYLYTSLLGQVMSGTEEENKKYFCDTYKEKLLLEQPQIFGMYWKDGEDETLRYVKIAANRQSGIEYRIIITPDNGEQYMIQDFTENKEFTLPNEESGIVTVVGRMQDSHEAVGMLEIPFSIR